MNINPQEPEWKERDRLVLSKGHCAPALYAALANRGYFKTEELKTFRSIEGRLQGHPDKKNIPGVDMSTGSLGTRAIKCKWNGNSRKIRQKRI